MITCQICNKIVKSIKGLEYHVRIMHNIQLKVYYDQYIKRLNEGICLYCGKETSFNSKNFDGHKYYTGYCKYCSKKCANDSGNLLVSYKQNCLKKYGVENVSQLEFVKEKRKQTCLRMFGQTTNLKCKETKDKIKQTNLKKYGVECSTQNKGVQDRKRFKMKPYLLPSGKIIYKQGYEPQFLDYIFKNNLFKEDEIDYSPNGIKYVSDKQHYYFPDFYIPKLNLIIEIKSWWTEQKDKNVALKEQACKNQGYNYLRIVDHNFNVLLNYMQL